jgi:hypothetical protein
MSSKRITTWLVHCLISMCGALLMACASAPPAQQSQEPQQSPPQQSKSTQAEPHVEAQAAPSPNIALFVPSPPPEAAATVPAKLPPPKPTEINDAVVRIFKKTATSDINSQPSFVVGDFNGDGSEDLAVVVKPDEASLSEINSEVANWTLEDPGNVPIPGLNARQAVAGKGVHAEKGNTLLAIIHGVGPHGWRNSEARQSYLLKNGAGSEMVVQTAARLRSAKDKGKLPPLLGDAIQETIEGKSGLLFWTGAKYAWYSKQAQAAAEVSR